MCSRLLQALDGLPCKPKRFAVEPVYRWSNAPGDFADADSNAQTKRAHPAAEVKQQTGKGIEPRGHDLKFVSGGNCVRQPDPFFAQMRARGGAETRGEQRAQRSARSRGDHVGDYDGMKACSHCTNLYNPIILYAFMQ